MGTAALLFVLLVQGAIVAFLVAPVLNGPKEKLIATLRGVPSRAYAWHVAIAVALVLFFRPSATRRAFAPCADTAAAVSALNLARSTDDARDELDCVLSGAFLGLLLFVTPRRAAQASAAPHPAHRECRLIRRLATMVVDGERMARNLETMRKQAARAAEFMLKGPEAAAADAGKAKKGSAAAATAAAPKPPQEGKGDASEGEGGSATEVVVLRRALEAQTRERERLAAEIEALKRKLVDYEDLMGDQIKKHA